MTTAGKRWGRGSGLLALLMVAAVTSVQASEDVALIDAINAYRGEIQRCGVQASEPLPPLADDPRLVLPANGTADLQDALGAAGYPLVNVKAITLSGPRDARSAMQALSESFCRVLLDPQFIDVGVSQQGRDWRIVLARPLLSGRLQTWQAEGEKLLMAINRARAQARHCGAQAFGAADPLAWNAPLGSAAESHSRAMANDNFFAHQGRDGRTPGDRAELAGYGGGRVGENIAAALDTPAKVVEGWLASPGHCANIMNPEYSELGAAYASDPQSDAGIYWTALFGGQ
ncbi:Allergen V5/TPX-1 family protein [Ectopseudomonas oleovorans]|uniref:Allergen V5/TPX-1 family protein n=2 Tax=Gammaproteobacteria TaxID=1236 RepID=A0A653AZI1_ECTOL|nr:Allergen V5/TPX-1 family protein [Pseudomonas oleovorans]